MDTLVWAVLPYLAFAVFVLGHVWRWRHDQFGWRTFQAPLIRNRLLRLGSPLVHAGLFAVLIGHMIGLFVPKSWTAAVGITDAVYRVISVSAGTLAGAAMLAGLVLLIVRRIVPGPVRRTTTVSDVVMYLLLATVVLLGVWATVGTNVFGTGHDYRDTVSIWWRGVALLQPDPAAMAGVPLLFQLHSLGALALVAIWPFTRLVHAWAVPIGLLWQPSQRGRDGIATGSNSGKAQPLGRRRRPSSDRSSFSR